MPLFRKRPLPVEARKYTGTPESNREIIEWTKWSATPAHMGDMDGYRHILYITTLEGEHRVTTGDWVIKGIIGEFYPCKPSVFEDSYEQVPEAEFGGAAA